MYRQSRRPPARLAVELERLPRDVAAAVALYMRDHGLSQDALADLVGVDPEQLSQALSANADLTLRTLARIAAALDAHFRIELVPNSA
jgi:transcriptional regulator with XRE-family HTH domain